MNERKFKTYDRERKVEVDRILNEIMKEVKKE